MKAFRNLISIIKNVETGKFFKKNGTSAVLKALLKFKANIT